MIFSELEADNMDELNEKGEKADEEREMEIVLNTTSVVGLDSLKTLKLKG